MSARRIPALFLASALAGCGAHGALAREETLRRTTTALQQHDEPGRLDARPGGTPATSGEPGLHRLGLGSDRDGLLYVPPSYRPDRPMPLVLTLHGAGGDGQQSISILRGAADELGFIVLAPDSCDGTWDFLLDQFGPDVDFIDRALAKAFAEYAVAPDRVAVAGFSDGASYAVTLGIMNGDLFKSVLAFSPGFAAPTFQTGAPRVFVSHGTEDRVLPIARCSRTLVPALRRRGLDVDYREFDGSHAVPKEIALEGARWFLGLRS